MSVELLLASELISYKDEKAILKKLVVSFKKYDV